MGTDGWTGPSVGGSFIPREGSDGGGGVNTRESDSSLVEKSRLSSEQRPKNNIFMSWHARWNIS